jgi:hypothetical protein
MPINFIPNQPFIWESPLTAQPCLNNDIKVYSQMVQPDDIICVQQQMTPCNETINCEPTMSGGVIVETLGTGTFSGGWSSIPSPLTINYDGTGGVVGICEFGINDPLSAQAGYPYRVDFTIVSVTGVASVKIGMDIVESVLTYDQPGTYSVEMIPISSSTKLGFIMNPSATTASDTIEITDIVFYRVSDCWHDAIVDPSATSSSVSWRYSLDTDDFLTFAIGKFCSSLPTGGDLINDTAYVTDGNYHRVNFRITDCSQGGVEVLLGGTSLGTTTGNGDFIYYGVPNDASGELRFRKTDNFDGCIDNATVDDFGFVDPSFLTSAVYKLQVANSSGSGETDELSFTLFDDRITWCFDVSELTNAGEPIELSCDIEYKLLLTEQCEEDLPVENVSVTTLRYSQQGWYCTKVFEAYNEGYAFGFYFGSTTAPDFKLIQRLRVLQFAPIYPAIGEEYLYSSGTNSRSYAQSSKIRTAWFDYCDEATHDVIRLQVLSDIAKIDSQQVFCPVKDYEPEWDEHRRNLAQSRVDMQLVSEVSLFKRNC